MRPDIYEALEELQSRMNTMHARIDALEAERETARRALTFAERRPVWTVRELAADLGISEQSIRNYLALPEGHSRKLQSFQPSPGSPHSILAEHISDWMERCEKHNSDATRRL